MDRPEMYGHEVSMIFFLYLSLEAVKLLNRAFSRHFNIFLMTDRQTDGTDCFTPLCACAAAG